MADLIQFEYDGHQVTFDTREGQPMINATEMAKPFNKLPGGFLRIKSTKAYLEAWKKRYADLHNGEPVVVIQGGKAEEQGTWMARQVALKFAAWLDPDFEVWVYEKLEELMSSGVATLEPLPIAKALTRIKEQLEAYEQDTSEIRQQLEALTEEVGELRGRFADTDYFTITGWANLHRIPCPLHQAKAWGKAASAYSRNADIPTGTAHNPTWGKVRTYHRSVLVAVMGEGPEAS